MRVGHATRESVLVMTLLLRDDKGLSKQTRHLVEHLVALGLGLA